MSSSNTALVSRADDPLVFAPTIVSALGITPRGFRKWLKQEKFAPPDTNINGRNAWLTSTYQREMAAIMAGRLKQVRRPFSESAADPKTRSA